MRLTEINLYHVILGTGKQVTRGLYNSRCLWVYRDGGGGSSEATVH